MIGESYQEVQELRLIVIPECLNQTTISNEHPGEVAFLHLNIQAQVPTSDQHSDLHLNI